MKRTFRLLAGSVLVTTLMSSLGSAVNTPRAGLNLIPDNSLNWGALVRANYSIEDSTFGVLGASQTWTAPNTFSSSTYLSYGTPGQCVATDANDQLITQSCLAGGSGASTLAIYRDGVQVSSPTAIIKFNGNQFRAGLPGGNTAQVDLNPSTTYFVQNTVVRQAGAAFSVDSGTVANLLTAGTAQITSGTYTNATISGPTLAYSSGTVSVALAIGTSSVNGQPLRVVDTTGNGVISFESPLSTTTMTINLKNATAGSSAGLVQTVQGAADAPTGAIAGDAIVRATNNLFLESGGPTSGRGIAISTNGVTSVYYADGSTSTSASSIRPDLIQMPSVGSTSSPLITMVRTGGPFGFNYYPIQVINSFYLDNVGFKITGASGTAIVQVASPINAIGQPQGSFVQTGDVEIPIATFGAAPSGQNIWIHKYSFTQPFGSFAPNTDYGVRISSKGVAINPGFLPLDQPETFHIGSGTTTPNASSMIMAVSTNSAGTMGVIANSHQFYAGIVGTYAVVGSTSSTDLHIQAGGLDEMVVSSITGVTAGNLTVTSAGVATPVVVQSNVKPYLWLNENQTNAPQGEIDFTTLGTTNTAIKVDSGGFRVLVGTQTNDSAANMTDRIVVSRGSVASISLAPAGEPVIFGGAVRFASKTSATLNTISPAAVGETYYCSDCATVPVCTSTGTAAGAFALITSKTSRCQ